MSSGAVLYVSVLDALSREGRVEKLRIVVFHDFVVFAIDEKNWRTVLRDVLLQGKQVAHLLETLAILTQQGTPGTLMRAGMRHTHCRINGCHECRTSLFPLAPCPMLCRMHCQVSACREAHHADTMAVDAIFFGMFAQINDGSLQVVDSIWMLMPPEEKTRMRDVRHNALHTIFQHKSRDPSHGSPCRPKGARDSAQKLAGYSR